MVMKKKHMILIMIYVVENKVAVSLALTLALATIRTTPFLLLDKSFSSLDNETTDKCLEIMKKYCENKTIINV